MKRIILLLTTVFIYTISNAQWTSSTTPETTYDGVNLTGNIHNVGTDTRSGASGYGNSYLYANYLNVTVSDYRTNLGGRRMFWESSNGTSGSLNIPNDAIDPDVVLVEGNTPTDVWAIVVYYSPNAASPGNPGYYMSAAKFSTTYEFSFFAMGPALIANFTPDANFSPCINIDADNYGNYALVFQRIGGIESRTATYTSGTPVVPGNALGFSTLIEPDISISIHSTLDRVKIIALSYTRSNYNIITRRMTPTMGIGFSSPLMGELHNPRIASPTTMSTKFAITMSQKDAVGNHNILFNTFNGITPSGLKVINNGSEPAPYPGPINGVANRYPAITYHSSGGNEKITVAWHCQYIGGSPSLNNSFIGLDINPASLTPVTPSVYLDMSYYNSVVNNVSTIALSGRYTDWCKTTAFAYGNNPWNPTHLVWKYVSSANPNWKTAPIPGNGIGSTVNDKATHATLLAYPNPTKDIINFDLTKNTAGFTYEIFTQTGQSVLRNTVNDKKVSIPVNSLASGTYFVKLFNKDTKEVSGFKFLKE